MTIEQKIDDVLKTVTGNGITVKFYCGTPLFSGTIPDTYIFYDYYDIPVHYSADKYNEIEYYITINLISNDILKVISLTSAIKKAFEDNGFSYSSSGNLFDTEDEPPKKRKYQEFTINLGV